MNIDPTTASSDELDTLNFGVNAYYVRSIEGDRALPTLPESDQWGSHRTANWQEFCDDTDCLTELLIEPIDP